MKLFGLQKVTTVKNIWNHLYELTKENIHASHYEALDIILTQGTLATRIVHAVQDDYSVENIKKVYAKLANCLAENILFTK